MILRARLAALLLSRKDRVLRAAGARSEVR
jgi:hypothetical protein